MSKYEIENSKFEIEQIRPELTWRLRQRVMYPHKKLYEMEMEEDNEGYHFGAFKDNALIGVVSVFQNGREFQFRKFAVDTPFQKMGIGKMLLKHVVDFAMIESGERIWCNARVAAIGFYSKYGFRQTGVTFSKNGVDYEVMDSLLA